MILNITLKLKHSFNSAFSGCHWNNEYFMFTCFHSCTKVSQLKASVAIKTSIQFFLSKRYLDSSTVSDNDNLGAPGYNLMRSDHPNQILFNTYT